MHRVITKFFCTFFLAIAKMHTLDCKNAYRTILNTSTPVGVGTRLNVPTSCGP